MNLREYLTLPGIFLGALTWVLPIVDSQQQQRQQKPQPSSAKSFIRRYQDDYLNFGSSQTTISKTTTSARTSTSVVALGDNSRSSSSTRDLRDSRKSRTRNLVLKNTNNTLQNEMSDLVAQWINGTVSHSNDQSGEKLGQQTGEYDAFAQSTSITPQVRSSNNNNNNSTGQSVFYALADAPYSSAQSRRLLEYIVQLPSSADFVIHLGDIRSAKGKPRCFLQQYQDVSDILRQSSAPVFIVLGDNDWNDCPNHVQAFQYWMDTFLQFESRYWNHSFAIRRQSGRPENLSFVSKGTLYLALNIVGGRPPNMSEWYQYLSELLQWTLGLLQEYKNDLDQNGLVGQAVLFAHADPTHSNHHHSFFVPLAEYLKNDLNNELPFLYMNGDWHVWDYTTQFYGASSFLRITLAGETNEAPTKMIIQQQQEEQVMAASYHQARSSRQVQDIFQFQRR